MKDLRRLSTRSLELVAKAPDGLTASTASIVLGVSWATASSTLARLYWAGQVDRRRESRAFLYTARVSPCR